MEQLDNQVVCSVCGERYNLEEISAYTALERENEELKEKVRELAESKDRFATLARNMEETVDNVRAALGLESTHWLIIADQVGEVVKERDTFKAENAELRKRLEPIKEYWQNSKSIKYVEITSAHASIKKCMEMAPETEEK